MRKRDKKVFRLMDMPFEIVFMVLSQLHPDDLLRLMMVEKCLRDLLLRPSSSIAWKDAERSCGLPDCPDDLTHLKYARLIFGNVCTVCKKAPRALKLFFAFRVRLCKDCFSENVDFGWKSPFYIDCLGQGEPEMTDLVWLAPALSVPVCADGRRNEARWEMTRILGLQQNHQCPRCVFHLPTFQTACKQYLSLSDTEREEFASTTREKVVKIKEHARLFEDWQNDRRDERRSERGNLRAAFRKEVYKKLQESGYTDSDLDVDNDSEEISRKWKLLVEAPRTMSARVWKSLHSKLQDVIQLRRAKAVQDMSKKRRDELARASKEVMSSNPDRFVTVDDFVGFSEAKKVLESADRHVSFTRGQLEQLKELVLNKPKTPVEYTEDLCARLVWDSQISAGYEPSELPDRSIVKRKEAILLWRDGPDAREFVVVDCKWLIDERIKSLGETSWLRRDLGRYLYALPFPLIKALLDDINLPATTYVDMVNYDKLFKCLRCYHKEPWTWIGLVVHYVRENWLNNVYGEDQSPMPPDEDNPHYWDTSIGPLVCYLGEEPALGAQISQLDDPESDPEPESEPEPEPEPDSEPEPDHYSYPSLVPNLTSTKACISPLPYELTESPSELEPQVTFPRQDAFPYFYYGPQLGQVN